jgi:hypothetical protein
MSRDSACTGSGCAIVTAALLAPGGQDGLMGLALDLANNFVSTAYT